MAQELCLALLIFIVLANLDTTVSIYHVHPSIKASSLNMSYSFNDADPTKNGAKLVRHYARYRADSPPTGGYKGAMATLDVYSFPKSVEATGAIMWVTNGKPGQSDLNDLQAGWIVDPSYYGDSKTHFFVYWTADGYNSTGCYNSECDGFVPVNGAPITPGDTVDPAKGQSKISFKIFKNKDDGDWWLHFGYDINNLRPVGFWPKSLFTNLKDHAELITWGGFTSVQNVQLVDSTGQGHAPPAWALRVFASHKKCYQASPFFDSMFYYGGPGGCTD
ncbi:hypothetical protein BS78_10G238200 [Paspalum vaginatum]|nr:hypothetical protein BS78_10G238200 [Paspalum vaginatum]